MNERACINCLAYCVDAPGRLGECRRAVPDRPPRRGHHAEGEAPVTPLIPIVAVSGPCWPRLRVLRGYGGAHQPAPATNDENRPEAA